MFDFAGRKVVEDTTVPNYDIAEDKRLLDLFKDDAFSVEAEIKRRQQLTGENGTGSLIDPNLGINIILVIYE